MSDRTVNGVDGHPPDGRPVDGVPPAAARRSWLMTIDVLLLVAGFVFAVLAVGASFWAYFTLGGEPPNPTADELTVLNLLAAASVLAVLASFVVALVVRGRWAIVFGGASGLALVGALVLAITLTAPQGFYNPAPDVAPAVSPNHTPCYSGSTHCN